jgi:hypothetical protein
MHRTLRTGLLRQLHKAGRAVEEEEEEEEDR